MKISLVEFGGEGWFYFVFLVLLLYWVFGFLRENLKLGREGEWIWKDLGEDNSMTKIYLNLKTVLNNKKH